MAERLYEERFGPIARRLRRLGRAARWRVKRVLGTRTEILVEVRWRLGDEVMAIPIYEALRHRYPSARLTVWCNHPHLLDDNPFVDAINAESVVPDRYIALRSGPREEYRIAHYARCAGLPTPDCRPQLHYATWQAPQLDRFPQGDGPVVALSSGASWSTKRWPLDRWRALGGALERAGCRVVELGHDDDARIGTGTSLVGETTVREAACVLRAAALLVSCDSGLMHLARAAGTPVVALFGPTEPSILVRGDPDLIAVKTERDCQGCWNRADHAAEVGVCPLDRPACLDPITVDAVLARVRERLGLEG